MPLLARMRAALPRLLPVHQHSQARLVVAVSGGADSLCLLHLLVRLRAELSLDLHVAHLDHGLRGEESAAEAHFVSATATAWGLPCQVGSRDVAIYAQQRQLGTQAAARELRYAFLAEVARDADAVAVAHNADDQAETLLLHLLRGAGPAGLRGMREWLAWPEWSPLREQPTGARLIRPLLDVSRADIDAYCEAHGLMPRQDPSNTSPKYLRSRVRHELLPLLVGYNPQIRAALARSARIAADDYDFLRHELEARWPELTRVSADTVRFERKLFHDLHPALRRYALRQAVETLLGAGRALDFARIEEAIAVALGRVGGRLALPAGLRLEVAHAAIAISRGELQAEADAPQLTVERVELPREGTVSLGNGWYLRVTQTEVRTPPSSSPCWSLQLDGECGQAGLALRRRKPGDRMRPGVAGSRRLQDLFVDQKLPRELRAAWPVLVSGDSIVWVPGIAVDTRYLVTDLTQVVVYIELAHERN